MTTDLQTLDMGQLEELAAPGGRVEVAHLTLNIAHPLYKTLRQVATRNHATITQVVKQAIFYALPRLYPEFENLYRDNLIAAVEQKQGGQV